MRWFHDLRLARKLGLTFAVGLAVSIAVGLLALGGAGRVHAGAAALGGRWLPSVHHSLTLARAVADFRGVETLHVIATRRADMDTLEVRMTDLRGVVAAAERDLARTVRSAQDSAALADFRRAWAAYDSSNARLVKLSRALRTEDAYRLLRGDSQQRYTLMSGALVRIAAAAGEGARAQVAAGAATYAGTRRLVLAALVLVVAGGVVTGVLLVRHIAGPLTEISDKMRRLAEGDVDQQTEVRSRDEVGQLAESFRTIVAAQADVARAARRMAEGDVTVPVTPRGERDALAGSFAQVQDTLRALVAEAGALTEAARAGRLDARADAKRFAGAYRELVEGMNAMTAELAAPMAELSEVMGRVGARDLTARMRREYAGELARLTASVNTAVETLDGAFAQVAAAGVQVAAASGEIAGGSTALATGASQQAGALEEVSASLAELAAAAKQNAANARQAQGMAENARGGAAAGVASMERLSEAVERIKRSADRTASVVKTIDEIAFQTNLLALNAAVEAARAGEAGRGFAVVAEEVRALAQRSAAAARETGTLIDESVRAAEEGVTLNREVLERLGQINTDVDRVGEVMAEIAAASEQQDLGVGQINGGLEAMNGVTQQVATNAEEGSSAAVELASQADAMRDLVGTFRLSAAAAPAAPRPPRGPALNAPPPKAPAPNALALRKAPAPKPAGAVVPAPRPARAATSGSARVPAPVPAPLPVPSRVPPEAWDVRPETLIPFDDDDTALGEF